MYRTTIHRQDCQGSGILGTIIAYLTWLHSVIVRPVVQFWNYTVLGAIEESISSLIREALALTRRTLNGVSAWTLSVFNRDYKAQLRNKWQEMADQYSWWGQDGSKQGTLNQVIARRYGVSTDGSGTSQVGALLGDSTPGTKALSGPSTNRRTADGCNAASTDAPAGCASPAPALNHATAHKHNGAYPANCDSSTGTSAIEAAESIGSTASAAGSCTASLTDSEGGGAASADAQSSAASQWWEQGAAILSANTPAWLSAVSEEAQEKAAAAQTAATAAVQQAATTVTTAVEAAVEEATAAAAALARNMRGVFEQQPAGWGANEVIRRTGLLEDLSLFSQLLVTRVFDAMRWIVDHITFTSTAPATNRTLATRIAARKPLADDASVVQSGTSGSLRHRQGASAPSSATAASDGASSQSSSSNSADSTCADGSPAIQVASQGGEHLSTPSKASAVLQGLSWPWASAADKKPAALKPMNGKVNWASTPEVSVAPGFKRRSATSIDLPRTQQIWLASDSEQESGNEADDSEVPSSGASNSAGANQSPFSSEKVQTDHQAALADIALVQSSRDQQQGPEQPPPHKQHNWLRERRKQRHQHQHPHHKPRPWSKSGAIGGGGRLLQRSYSGPAVSELKELSSAGQVIRMAGYPLEVHEVVTVDGYLLRMERIPQHSSADVVLLMHGVLDTSLTWVAGGVTGSQAFAAWDRGLDVWLGTSRSNPPHTAVDPKRRGSAYWLYTLNEVGQHDMAAQIDHIHAVKMKELAAAGVNMNSSSKSKKASSGDGATMGSGTVASVVNSTVSKVSMASHGISASCSRLHNDTSSSSEQDVPAALVHVPDSVGTAEQVPPSVAVQMAGNDTQSQSKASGDASSNSTTHASAFAPVAEIPLTPRTRLHALTAAVSDLSQRRSSQGNGDGCLNSRTGCNRPLGRTQSAAQADAVAAAEAAAALSRHRAARAAAGLSSMGSGSTRGSGSVGEQATAVERRAASGSEGRWWLGGVKAPNLRLGRRRSSIDMGTAAAISAAAAGGTANNGATGGTSAAGTALSADAVSVVQSAMRQVLGGINKLAAEQQDMADVQSDMNRPSSRAESMRHVLSAPDIAAMGGGVLGIDDTALNSKINKLNDTRAVNQPVKAVSGSANMTAATAPVATAAAEEHQQERQQPQQGLGGISALSKSDERGAVGTSSNSNEHVGSSSSHSGWLWPFERRAHADCKQPAVPAGQAVEQQEQQQQQQQEAGTIDIKSPNVQEQQATEVLLRLQPKQAQQGSSAKQQGGQQLQYKQEQLPATPNSSSKQVQPEPAATVTGSPSIDMPDPYNLRVVAHSLGGFMTLIFCVQRASMGRPHHVRRLILLSPAGFHPVIPGMFKPVVAVWKYVMLFMKHVWRQQAFPVHLPTFVARLLTFKVFVDATKLPAVGDLVQAFAKLALGGDRSAWDRALLMPHYAAAGMPLLSSLQVMHFCQLYQTGQCQLYDFGSVAANVMAYQQSKPPAVSDAYHTLRGVPVHLVTGLHDGVIPPSNIQLHYQAMKAAGVDVSYRQFDYGHMDFTFSAKEELGYYVMSLLMRE